MELSRENAESAYTSLVLDSKKFNIVMLHGQESKSAVKDRAEIINLKALRMPHHHILHSVYPVLLLISSQQLSHNLSHQHLTGWVSMKFIHFADLHLILKWILI